MYIGSLGRGRKIWRACEKVGGCINTIDLIVTLHLLFCSACL